MICLYCHSHSVCKWVCIYSCRCYLSFGQNNFLKIHGKLSRLFSASSASCLCSLPSSHLLSCLCAWGLLMMISWLEFPILSLLIAWSGALADKGAWNFREMRVELIYQSGSSFCFQRTRGWGDITQRFVLCLQKSCPPPCALLPRPQPAAPPLGLVQVFGGRPMGSRKRPGSQRWTCLHVGDIKAFGVVAGTFWAKGTARKPAFPGGVWSVSKPLCQ